MTDESHLYDHIQRFRPMAEKAAGRLPCEAQDILHTAYVRWVEYIRKFQPPELENPDGFAYVMVRNTISNMMERQKTETKYDEPYQKRRTTWTSNSQRRWKQRWTPSTRTKHTPSGCTT
jgi:DNA-directed RNA polymerase specialized sigma24 family protein